MEKVGLMGNHNCNNKIDYDHLGYNMLMASFKYSDIHKGLQRSLFFAKMFTQASDVILYKLDKNGDYNQYSSGSTVSVNNEWLNILIRQGRRIIESRDVYYFDCGDIFKDKDVFLVPLLSHNTKYIVAVKNCSVENIHKDEKFIKVFRDSMNAIIDRLEQYDKINKKSRRDDLTGLNNRNAYEEAIKVLDKSDEKFTLVLFDLFRLKFINDNYNYLLGDAYIIKTAELLKKYFPKYITYRDRDGNIKKESTGSCIYRLGGDEFVLVNKNESIEDINIKLSLLKDDVSDMDLNVASHLDLGINYGIAIRKNGETIRELSLIASDNLKEDKAKMYAKYGIERRK